MKPPVSDIAFTPTVKAIQEQMGSRSQYVRMEERSGWSDTITQELADFLSERDSFYLATASAEGRPYIQHRGGPKGFLKVLDDRTLAFADFTGNRQYITVGNLAENNKVHLFLMDYPNQTRIKIWGTAKVVDNDPELLKRLHASTYRGKAERIILITVEAWDINCRQHIQPRFTSEETRGNLTNASRPHR